MATSKKSRTRASAARPSATDGQKIRAAREAEDPDSLRALLDPALAIDGAFKQDDRIQKSLSKNLRPRAKNAASVGKRVDKAFGGFRPSRFTTGERAGDTYLAPSESLVTTTDRLIAKSVKSIQESPDRRSLRLRVTDEVRGLISGTDGEGGSGTMVFTDVLDLLKAKLPTTLSLRENPLFTSCAVEKEAKKRLDAIEGKSVVASPPSGPTDAVIATNGQSTDTEEFVADRVHLLMDTVPSPEEVPVLRRPASAGLKPVAEGLGAFALAPGPSDVTSYHDFTSLQIAFEHVWAEVFDPRLEKAARELYHAYIELLDFTDYRSDPVKSVSSIEDIRRLMTHARELGRVTDNATPTAGPPAELLAAFDELRTGLQKALFPLLLGQTEAVVNEALRPLAEQIQALGSTSTGTNLTGLVPNRLAKLLQDLDDLLQEPYAFTVFRERSCNFGIMTTYRQKWVPEAYQVGDLVSTIPLAPRETRRYTTKRVARRSRTTKEIENNLRITKSDFDTTSRVDRAIVDRAENKTNFRLTADGSYGTDAAKIRATADAATQTDKLSETTKKDFRDAVLRSAQEYKHDHRMEIETTTSDETEDTTFHEIQNPNDELTVTYLLYELQRTYRISEKIHQMTPVVLVANEVPAPNEITDTWLIEHDWILRRVILDDSLRPALDYLTKSFTGSELGLQILDNNAQAQRQVVDAIKAQVAAQMAIVEGAQRDLTKKMDTKAGLEFTEGILGTIKSVFDPFKLTGPEVTGTSEGMKTVAEYAQETFERAEREKARLLDQLGLAVTALQTAVDKLTAEIKTHYDRVAEIDRLRVHVKENILYYMQAIWDHEPPDQRYFRVFHVQVPIVSPKSTNTNVPVTEGVLATEGALRDVELLEAVLPFPDFEIEWRSLVEIADLDEVLGYKGNYAIYRLRENNFLTLHMMQDYIELSDILTLRDPDDIANYTVAELQELATCLYGEKEEVYEHYREEIKRMIIARLTSGRAEDDRVIVPTDSLFIEALVGSHPLLEDFKLIHRGLDVKKVQAEVRHGELENVRLAARALTGKDEDPDIERKIVVEGATDGVIVEPD